MRVVKRLKPKAKTKLWPIPGDANNTTNQVTMQANTCNRIQQRKIVATIACLASVSVRFSEAFFAFWPRENWGGREKVRAENLTETLATQPIATNTQVVYWFHLTLVERVAFIEICTWLKKNLIIQSKTD